LGETQVCEVFPRPWKNKKEGGGEKATKYGIRRIGERQPCSVKKQGKMRHPSFPEDVGLRKGKGEKKRGWGGGFTLTKRGTGPSKKKHPRKGTNRGRLKNRGYKSMKGA